MVAEAIRDGEILVPGKRHRIICGAADARQHVFRLRVEAELAHLQQANREFVVIASEYVTLLLAG